MTSSRHEQCLGTKKAPTTTKLKWDNAGSKRGAVPVVSSSLVQHFPVRILWNSLRDMAPPKVTFADDGITRVESTLASGDGYHGDKEDSPIGDIQDFPEAFDRLEIDSDTSRRTNISDDSIADHAALDQDIAQKTPTPDFVFGADEAHDFYGIPPSPSALKSLKHSSAGLALVEDLYGTGEKQTFHEYTLSVSDYAHLMYTGGNEPSAYVSSEHKHVITPGTTTFPDYLVTRRVLMEEGYPFVYEVIDSWPLYSLVLH